MTNTIGATPEEREMIERLPIFERVTRLADTLSCDVPITAEARKKITDAYDQLAALNTTKGQSNGE